MDDEDEDYSPEFQTERFDVFHCFITRNPKIGMGRSVYMAWFRDDDVPHSVCEITLWGNYVEWINVCDGWRRRGIGREVLRGLEKHVGCLNYEGATEAGEAFCKAMSEEKTNAE